MTPQDDFELLQAWRDGDSKAGNDLFHRHFDSICRFFSNKLQGDVEDLIQRTFLACVEGRDRFSGQASFRAYLFGIARNVLHRYFRDKSRQQKRFSSLESSAADVAPGPSLLLAEKREQRLLLTALRRLPLDHQITLELYYWENLSGPELAGILELPEGTVRGRIRRAKQLLEEELKACADSPELLRSTIADLESWARSLQRESPYPLEPSPPPEADDA